MKKKLVAITIFAFITAMILCGCRMYKNLPSGAPSPTLGTPSPSITSKPGIASYPPGKTASQDTKGAITSIPEEATAAGTAAP